MTHNTQRATSVATPDTGITARHHVPPMARGVTCRHTSPWVSQELEYKAGRVPSGERKRPTT